MMSLSASYTRFAFVVPAELNSVKTPEVEQEAMSCFPRRNAGKHQDYRRSLRFK
jgi:hypothetical protein